MLQSNGESINRARERRLLVERQLVEARTLPPVASPVSGQGGSQPDSLLSSPLPQQLAAAKTRLAAAQLRLKPSHPEVRALQRLIQDLQQRVDEEARRPPAETAAQGLPREERDRLKRIGELEAELEVIDHQVKVSQEQQTELQAKISDYQRKVEAVPARESELVELTRDYDSLKRNYEELVKKREDSKLAANLERRQIGEQFRILDAASLPQKPTNEMTRLGLIFSGAGVGLLLGLAFVGFLEYRDSSFALEQDVFGALELPVLAAIPAMQSVEERRGVRRRRLALDLVGVTVLLASVIVVTVWGSSL
jgi:uncharacterized protein involved in exopolysaccharide biosynthesis